MRTKPQPQTQQGQNFSQYRTNQGQTQQQITQNNSQQRQSLNNNMNDLASQLQNMSIRQYDYVPFEPQYVDNNVTNHSG